MYFKKFAEYREYLNNLNNDAINDSSRSEISNDIDVIIEKYEASSIKGNKSVILLLEEQIEEGILSRTLGGLTGIALGYFIGKILSKVLGVKPNSILHKILTSKTVAFSIGSAIGKSNKLKR